MDPKVIALLAAMLIAWAVYWFASRYQRQRARELLRVAPVFRLTVTAERARELAEQRTRLAVDAESAALARGEQTSFTYAARVRCLGRMVSEVPPEGSTTDMYDRD